MSAITLRSVKGSALTNDEVDDNFTALNNDKLEAVSGDTAPVLGGALNLSGFALVETLTAAAGNTFAAGEIGYVSAIGIVKASATAEATAKGGLWAAAEAVSAGAAGPFVKLGSFSGAGLTPGAEYYLSTTPGAITAVRPSSTGTIVRALGTALSATVFFFEPGIAYVENS